MPSIPPVEFDFLGEIRGGEPVSTALTEHKLCR
jgi:hypothetical protein